MRKIIRLGGDSYDRYKMARTHFWTFHQSALWKVFHLDDQRNTVGENREIGSDDIDELRSRISDLEKQSSKLCMTVYVLFGSVLALLFRIWS